VGDEFVWGEYDTEAAAEAALRALVANNTVHDAYLESITSDWWCSVCPGGTSCMKYYTGTPYESGGGVAFNPATGKWNLYIDITAAGTCIPCCTECPL
jgi:hypothetical protein